MTSQPLEPRVQVLEDDLSETRRIQRENALQIAALTERQAHTDQVLDRVAERLDRIAERQDRTGEQIARNAEMVTTLAGRMDGVTRQLELLTVAVQAIHGHIDRDYEPGPSGRSDDPPSKSPTPGRNT